MKLILAIILTCTFIFNAGAQEIQRVKVTELATIISQTKGPLIVNFWATFCLPCLEEIPYFQQAVEGRKNDSVKLLLVSLDLEETYPAKLKAFVTKRNFTAPVQWLDEYNADYFIPKIDSSWTGAIPASLFVNQKTGYRRFLEEQVSPEKLNTIIQEMLEERK